jgi:hypothetical protein
MRSENKSLLISIGLSQHTKKYLPKLLVTDYLKNS